MTIKVDNSPTTTVTTDTQLKFSPDGGFRERAHTDGEFQMAGAFGDRIKGAFHKKSSPSTPEQAPAPAPEPVAPPVATIERPTPANTAANKTYQEDIKTKALADERVLKAFGDDLKSDPTKAARFGVPAANLNIAEPVALAKSALEKFTADGVLGKQTEALEAAFKTARESQPKTPVPASAVANNHPETTKPVEATPKSEADIQAEKNRQERAGKAFGETALGGLAAGPFGLVAGAFHGLKGMHDKNVEERMGLAVKEGISFKTGTAELDREANLRVKALASGLKNDPNTKMQVIAHAATPELAEQRADALRAAFSKQGISTDRLVFVARADNTGEKATFEAAQ